MALLRPMQLRVVLFTIGLYLNTQVLFYVRKLLGQYSTHVANYPVCTALIFFLLK